MQGSTSTETSLVVDRIKSQFPNEIEKIESKPNRVKVVVKNEKLVELASFVRDELGFDHPILVGGTDFPKDNQFEVIYHLTSISKPDYRKIVLGIATRIPKDNSVLPSLIGLWSGVEYHERETFEMLGIRFEGHPILERLLLPEDWNDIPPLRKDFHLPGR